MVRTYTSILVATDFSDIGNDAVIQAAGLAELMQAKLTLLHVIEHFPEDMAEDQIPPENRDPKHFFMQQSQHELDSLRQQVGQPQAQIEVVMTDHSAGHEIAAYANQRDVDLIVVGTHGNQGVLDRLGSTASVVMHDARKDVLIIRAKQ